MDGTFWAPEVSQMQVLPTITKCRDTISNYWIYHLSILEFSYAGVKYKPKPNNEKGLLHLNSNINKIKLNLLHHIYVKKNICT